MRVTINPRGPSRFRWSAQISNGATWEDSFDLYDTGNVQISTAASSTWKLVLKRGGSVIQTLTSGDEITVTQATTKTTFDIEADVSTLNGGDYDADFGEETSGGIVRHWCSGTFTVADEDLGF